MVGVETGVAAGGRVGDVCAEDSGGWGTCVRKTREDGSGASWNESGTGAIYEQLKLGKWQLWFKWQHEERFSVLQFDLCM